MFASVHVYDNEFCSEVCLVLLFGGFVGFFKEEKKVG